MKEYFKPDLRYRSVADIDFEELKRKNVRNILLDLDNTIIDFYKNLGNATKKWVQRAKQSNFNVYILSNTNKEEKVRNVANELQIQYVNNAKKPLKSGFKKAIKAFNILPEETAMVGDQVFTDVVGANIMNMISVYVDPIGKEEHFYTKWKRPIESWILKRYQKM